MKYVIFIELEHWIWKRTLKGDNLYKMYKYVFFFFFIKSEMSKWIILACDKVYLIP